MTATVICVMMQFCSVCLFVMDLKVILAFENVIAKNGVLNVSLNCKIWD